MPRHFYDQDTLLAALREHWGARHFNAERLERLHRNVLVRGRHLALPLERYPMLASWGESNDAFIQVAQEVGEAAVRDALDRAGLGPRDVDALLFTTITGVATPSIDARLVNRLGLRRDVKRLPIFGLGCMAGAAGVARAADYVRGFPGDVAVVLAVELCSLTLQRDDLSVPNLIATGLFGDGAAAVVLAGRDRPGEGPRVLGTRSVFYPDTERIMGWDISESGFKLVLSADLAELVRGNLAGDVDAFLSEHGLRRSDVAHWICHPGGPRVLETVGETLGLPDGALELSWRSLREVGNLSSASVLFVLRDTLDERRPAPGERALLLAMGPGFATELVLLEC